MPSERFDLLRQLGAKYWKPIISLVAVIVPAVKAIKDSSSSSTGIQTWIWIAAGLLVIVIVRFPRIAVSITRVILGPPSPPSNLPMIFRGPRPYTKEDRDAFPGRRKEIDDCWVNIQQRSFNVIDGESGCGKSSILNAALMPRAREEFRVIECRIADDPFGKLLSALRQETYRRREQPVSKEDLNSSIADAAKPDTGDAVNRKPLLLCIDQFEELFATVKDDTRNQFLDVLKGAMRDGKLRLIVALRSDFFDLLMKICDKVDPEREALDLGNYYTIRAFSKEQAEAVLGEMLAPIHADNPMLEPQIEDFTKALIRELLRPPRDKRLCKDDEKTVLPVELQTVGMMIETSGVRSFSASRLKQLGGKLGLLRAYIEEAKTYVWRKTAVNAEKALLILRQLISPAQTKWAQTPHSIAVALNLPDVQVKRVLDAFADKYLVNPLLIISDEAGAENAAPVQQYELMHEHLVQILVEAPDPILQKARDAEERLRFWSGRTQMAHRPLPEDKKRFWRLRGGSLLAQPIPLIESLALWRFARSGDERRMLKRNLRGFSIRVAIIAVPALVALTAWEIWIRTDEYQIRRIALDAPVKELVSSRNIDRNAQISELSEWIVALAYVSRIDQAITVARETKDARQGPSALATASVILGRLNKTKDAKRLLDEAQIIAYEFKDNELSEALLGISKKLSEGGQVDDAQRIALEIKDADSQSKALASVSKQLAKTGKVDEALTIVSRIKDGDDRADTLMIIASELNTLGRSKQAKDVLYEVLNVAQRGETYFSSRIISAIYKQITKMVGTREAMAIAGKTKDPSTRAKAIVCISEEMSNAEAKDVLFKALNEARQINNKYFRSKSILEICKQLAKKGEASSAQTIVPEITDREDRAKVFINIANEFSKCGKANEANEALDLAISNTRNGNDTFIYQFASYVAICGQLAKAGRVNEALEIVAELKTYNRSRAFEAIFLELLASGKDDLALTLTREIENVDSSNAAFIALPKQFAAASKISQALSIAREIKDDYTRARALINIQQEIEKSSESDNTSQILDESLTAALRIKNYSSQSYLLEYIAHQLARRQSYRMARLIADNCYSSADKINVYSAILTEYAKARNPELRALLEAKEKQEKEAAEQKRKEFDEEFGF